MESPSSDRPIKEGIKNRESREGIATGDERLQSVGSGVGEAYEDISAVVLSVLKAEFSTSSATE
jgi:hypothetical protein